MALRPSRASDVARLIDDLVTGDAVHRESAGARLAVIGTRAVERLLEVAGDTATPIEVRTAALRTLGAIGDIRAVPLATSILDRGPADMALEAIDILGSVVERKEPQATAAFERLAEIALSPRAQTEHRLAAIATFERLPPRLVAPIRQMLESDPALQVSDRVRRERAGARAPLATLISRELPTDPAIVAAVVREEGAEAELSTLRAAVDQVRQREQAAKGTLAGEWRIVRAALHQVLASRGSRIALYDLRETFERAKTVLPVGFYGAAAAVGDASIVESLAAAWAHAAESDDRQWRGHIADAFGAIVAREGLTRRHETMKKILQRWPAAGVLVAKAAKAPRAGKTSRPARTRR